MTFRVGVDVGGTCTDTAVMDEAGRLYIGKALTTYPDFSQGIFDSLSRVGETLSLGLDSLLSRTTLFLHATTVGENVLLEREGSPTGLITTGGFEDTLHAMRGGYGRWIGLPFEQAKDGIRSEKPEQLVPRERIHGLGERMYRDRVIRPIEEAEVLEAARALLEDGVRSLACCLLWSFARPDHEREVGEILRRHFPDLPVFLSHEISPALGEYERTSTTVISAYIGPTLRHYLEQLTVGLDAQGFKGTFLLMFAHGGLVTPQIAIRQPVGVIESGPVAGLAGSRFVGRLFEERNIISTDMGGTTFKVGVISDDRMEYADEPLIGRHPYYFPKLDVHSLPLAGGSIVSLEEGTLVPRIGPQSAGSDPGPICYGRGGEEVTVTDVDLILGYFSPEFFLGGTETMAVERTFEIFEQRIAKPLGKSALEAAADMYRVVNSMIADFIHETTVEKGIDPRRFVLSAIGGAAGMHAATYARKLQIPRVIIPYTASVHSALGLLASDVSHEHLEIHQMQRPFDLDVINRIFARLMETARAGLAAEGFEAAGVVLEKSLSLRYQRQVHELLTPVPGGGRLTRRDLDRVLDEFDALYEQRYGKGSALKEGNVEITEFRVRGVYALSKPELRQAVRRRGTESNAMREVKDMIFEGSREAVPTAIYEFERVAPGASFRGPCVFLTPVTTIVVNPNDVATVDEFRNVHIEIGGAR
jgi:N-methylhydantoinase A